MLVVAVVAALLLRRTRLGYHMFAVGGNDRGGPALGRAHRPHADRGARALLAVPPASPACSSPPGSAPASALVYDDGLRPGLHRRRRARRHAAAGRPGRGRRHRRRGADPRGARHRLQRAAGRPVLQGRPARRDHRRRRRPLRPAPDRPEAALTCAVHGRHATPVGAAPASPDPRRWAADASGRAARGGTATVACCSS